MNTNLETKERPILFSAPMVRAILNGKKTQTRRFMNPQIKKCGVFRCEEAAIWKGHHTQIGPLRRIAEQNNPYGASGDRLWVKETFGVVNSLDHVKPSRLPRDIPIIYRASSAHPDEPSMLWRPSIFMPRWASRITLRIKDVRVERLQDISDADALAEGVTCKEYCGNPFQTGALNAQLSGEKETPVEAYKRLWDAINGAGSWKKNPWIWVIGFEVMP